MSFVPRIVPGPAQQSLTVPLIWPLVEESLSEAEFLWNRLDHALDAHDHSLADARSWVDERLQGALDGARIAGGAAVEPLLRDALHAFEPPLVAVAAYLLAQLSDPSAHALLEQGLRALTPSHASAFALGLGRGGSAQLLTRLWTHSQDATGLARAVLLEAFSFDGRAPEVDFRALLEHESAELRGAAASALRYVPQGLVQPLFELAFESDDAALRARAIAAGVARGNASCWWRCVEQVEEPDAESGPLLVLAALLGADSEIEHVAAALTVPELGRDALWALGFAGTARALEVCLAELRAGRRESLATEAICAISGLDLKTAQLLRPAGQEPEPDALSEAGQSLARLPGPDDRLPLPITAGVEAWWERARARFVPGVRYLAGRPLTLAGLCDALLHGPTRRRHALALSLSARSAGSCALQTRAFTAVQRSQLAGLAALASSELHETARVLGVPALAEA